MDREDMEEYFLDGFFTTFDPMTFIIESTSEFDTLRASSRLQKVLLEEYGIWINSDYSSYEGMEELQAFIGEHNQCIGDIPNAFKRWNDFCETHLGMEIERAPSLLDDPDFAAFFQFLQFDFISRHLLKSYEK